MMPNPKFTKLPKDFWANIRLISQHVGYTERMRRRPNPASGPRKAGSIKVPTLVETETSLRNAQMSAAHLVSSQARATALGKRVLEYFEFRARVLSQFVEPRLMDKAKARALFKRMRRKLCPNCPLPMNEQKGEKRAPAYFTGIVNMLIEANAQGLPCDYDPRELTTVTRNRIPFRTLARRIDGAFPSPINPLAVWEIKEYYYTTTFGSRVADGVYESLLDGMELEELREHGCDVKHYLMVDDHFTWWECGRSYLCRLVDMLHMGYVDEILFGTEILDRLPIIVKGWVTLYRKRAASRHAQ
jgi:hypothetical protein